MISQSSCGDPWLVGRERAVETCFPIRAGQVEDYFVLPFYFSIEYVYMAVKKYSIDKNMIDEQFRPLASMTNYLMSENKMFQV